MQNIANATEKLLFTGKHHVLILEVLKTRRQSKNTTTLSTPPVIAAAPKLMLTMSYTKCI